MSEDFDFAAHIGAVARAIFGEPNVKLSTKDQLRFGAHGSVAVDIAGDKRGTWFDHEAQEGGGVLDLVRTRKQLSNGAAIEWLRDSVGLAIPERDGRAPVEAPAAPARQPKLVRTYDYRSADGALLFQVCRYEPKTFRQRRPDIGGGWSWNLDGVERIPYRLPELMKSAGTVFVVEGEKDVDALWNMGLAATCNAGGAGGWRPSCAAALRGRDVVVLPDNDEAGDKHAKAVVASLDGIARSVRTIILPNLPKKGDLTDWLDAGGDREGLLALVAKTPTVEEKDLLPLEWFGDIQPSTEVLDFVQGTLAEQSSAVVYGDSNAGKTFLVTDLALHVAAGRSWMGLRVDQGGVAYCVLEGGSGFRNRIHAWKQTHGYEDVLLPFASIPASINLLDAEADTPRLIATIKRAAKIAGISFKLVVIDTLSRALAGGNENSSEDMGALVRNMDLIRSETGAAVLFIHHSGKDAAKGARGWSGLRAAIDTEIEVTADEEAGTREAKVVKQREMTKGQVYRFTLNVFEVGQNRHGEPVTSCTVEPGAPAEEGDSPSVGRSGRLSGDNQRAYDVLCDLIAERGANGYAGVPAGCSSVPEDWWRDQFYRRAKPGATPDARKHAFQRASTALINLRLVGMDVGRVWLVRGVPAG